MFVFVSTLWNTNEILLIYKKIVGIKFWKWSWWAMKFNPYRYCFQTNSPFLMTSYFVEIALTANHCGCQILQEQKFSSKRVLDAKYQSGFYFCKLFSFFTFFVSFKLAQFSHQSRILSCMYFSHLQDPWPAFMLKMPHFSVHFLTCEGFLAFLNISVRQVKKKKKRKTSYIGWLWSLAGIDFAWYIQATL